MRSLSGRKGHMEPGMGEGNMGFKGSPAGRWEGQDEKLQRVPKIRVGWHQGASCAHLENARSWAATCVNWGVINP